ncbi:uncharacterized protein LOC103703586 isoform X2 [Phoenix dactylifera]|uniref:Uncharacterized protein LOC103703586 isoform X2 n=1 Tax=Phoenix dactylifera TaxID=42345 RepID=A0A8B7BSV4_PHODC|nr:uncharacterized protein LOC103703586 isoform X2 [Phoenix dactylifera]
MRGFAGASGGRGRGGGEKYRNPCLTMHQPWASLLVHGIKRIEGRSWPAPLTGRLWIHAASKVPDPETIKAMEEFYREIYAINGITDIKFPEHYPVSRLLGCVEVVGCLKKEELVCWEALPESVRLEGQTDFCWLCQNPQTLLVPFEMRGYQGVYNLEKKIYEAAVRGLCPVQCPQPVKFPLPDPQDPLSLRPGSLASYFSSSKTSTVETPSSVSAAIAGARAAAAQFSKKDQGKATSSNQTGVIQKSEHRSTGISLRLTTEGRRLSRFPNGRSHQGYQAHNHEEQETTAENREHRRGLTKEVGRDLILQPRASSKWIM